MVKRLKEESDKFYLLWEEPECVNVCFWYIPKRLRHLPHSPEKEAELGKVCFTFDYFLLIDICVYKNEHHCIIFFFLSTKQ